MSILTLITEVASGHVLMRQRIARASSAANRAAFVAALLRAGLVQRLAGRGAAFSEIAAALECPGKREEALRAWLQLGVTLGILQHAAGGYRLRSRSIEALVRPGNDAFAAMAESIPIEQQFVLDTLDHIRADKPFGHLPGYSALVARQSRQVEPFVSATLTKLVPRRGAFHVLDVGCGSGGYLRGLAERNPDLSAVGIERISAVAELTRTNLRRWRLDERVRVEVGDLAAFQAGATFDLVLLNLVVHYTPPEQRSTLFRRVHALAKPGGCVFIANPVRHQGAGFEFLQLWASMSEGCGSIPEADEIEGALQGAGFSEVRHEVLIPGVGLMAFWARK